MFSLVVMSDFVATASGIFHTMGTIIEDQDEIASIIGSPQSTYVVRIPATTFVDDPDAPLEERAPQVRDPDAVH